MTWGHASASTQICTQRLPKAMKELRRMLEANTMAARALRAQCADRLTAQVSLDVLAGLVVEDAVGLLSHVAQVRRDPRVRELAERVVRGERLLVEDVEAGPGNGDRKRTRLNSSHTQIS